MTTAIAVRQEMDYGALERAVVLDDLSKLSPEERLAYYGQTCRSLGLNPYTRPFLYINLNGKLTLYATRGATDQLRMLHGVDIQIIDRQQVGDLYVVTARARLANGRTDEEIGAVNTAGLRGDALANAMMKCFHPDTEVLTAEGWKPVAAVGYEDRIAQYDCETDAIDFAHPVELVRSQTAAWIRVEDNISCQVVTPNHDVLVGSEKHEAQELMAAETQVKRWRGADQLPPVPVCGAVQSPGLDEPDVVVRLLAAFLSDGAWTKAESQVQFGFHRQRKVERLRRLLDEAGWPYSERVYDVQHNDRFAPSVETRTVFYVKTPAPWVLGHYLTADKALTMRTLLDLSTEQARALIDEMQFWDGSLDEKGGIIFQQTNRSIADSLQTLCVLHGIELSTRIQQPSPTALENAQPLVRMRMSQAKERPLRRARRSYTFFPNDEGLPTFCFGMPKGTVVTRFTGRVAISGNCSTKAKRRVTLSICGLGWLDESEVGSIPGAQPVAFEHTDEELKALAPPAAVEPNDAEATSTTTQRQRIAILRRKLALTDDDYRNFLEGLYGVRSSTLLTTEQAADFIAKLDAEVALQRAGVVATEATVEAEVVTDEPSSADMDLVTAWTDRLAEALRSPKPGEALKEAGLEIQANVDRWPATVRGPVLDAYSKAKQQLIDRQKQAKQVVGAGSPF